LWLDVLNLGLFMVLGILIWRRLSWKILTPQRRLLWFWVLGALLGLAAFDLWRRTYVLTHSRYALAGMPAALVLAGVGLGCLRTRTRFVLLTCILLMCLLGVAHLYARESRNEEPTRELGRRLAERSDASDVVIVHSIPSGVVALARYMNRDDIPTAVRLVSWVGQLGQRRVPEDILRLAYGRSRIFLVKIHDAGEPAPEEDWLRKNARLASEETLEHATLLSFVPLRGSVFNESADR
jgi:hypothetical protein